MLEMRLYVGIPHLLAPVVTDMRHAANALNWCVGEMEKRYRLMSKMGVRNLAGYNAKIRDAIKREEPIPNPFSLTPDRSEEHTSELQSLMRNSYAVFCLKKKKKSTRTSEHTTHQL